MSSAGNAIANNGLVKGFQQKGSEGLRGYGERKQGQWASKYNPNSEAGLASRAARRIGSGHILPTKRSQRLAIATGDKWTSENEEQALALIKRKGDIARTKGYETAERDKDGQLVKYRRDEQKRLLKKDGSLAMNKKEADRTHVSSYAEAGKETLTGVQAMKQMWVDLSEDGRDDFEKTMAIRQLNATSSWPEVQGSYTKSGKKVYDTAVWNSAITKSPEDYPKILRSRVDATPHIVDSANKALETEKQRRIANHEATMPEIEEREFKSAYRINYSLEKQMSNEDFATQSDGFWEEASRMANQKGADKKLTKQALEIRTNLKKRLKAIGDAGPQAAQQLLGHLSTGGTLQENVDSILGDESITDYIATRGHGGEEPPDGGEGPTPPSTPPPTRPVGGGPTVSPLASGGEIEVNLHPPEPAYTGTRPTEHLLTGRMPADIGRWVQRRGGVQNISESDLTTIYNAQRGPLQQAARAELERIGTLQPPRTVPLPGSGPAASRIVQEPPRAEGSYPVRVVPDPDNPIGEWSHQLQESGELPPPITPPPNGSTPPPGTEINPNEPPLT